MGKSHSMFNINHDLLVYKAFYFFILGGFGSVFPYLPVYFRQIGLTADQVGLIVGMRPIIQFASAPFWAIMADKYKKRKAVLVMSVLSWLIMTLALAFVEPTNEICELRISNESHTHFINYTKIKTGFFRRSLLPTDYLFVQKPVRGVIESSPDLVVVPIVNNLYRGQQKLDLEDDSFSGSSSGLFKFSQLKVKTRSPNRTSFHKEKQERQIETSANVSKLNFTGTTTNKMDNGGSKTTASFTESKLNGTGKLTKKINLFVSRANVNNLNNNMTDGSVTKMTTANLSKPQEQRMKEPRANSTVTSSTLNTKSVPEVKENFTFGRSDEDDETKNEKGSTSLRDFDDFSGGSGSGETIFPLRKITKSKRHDMMNTLISLANHKTSELQSSDSSTKTKKSVPVVFDFSQVPSEKPIEKNTNASQQTIIVFQNQSSAAKGQNKHETNQSTINVTESYETNKNKFEQNIKLPLEYNLVANVNMSKSTIDKIKENIKNSVFDLNNNSDNSSSIKTNRKESLNISSNNSIPEAQISLQSSLTGTDFLHEGEVERARGGILNDHKVGTMIEVPYSALRILHHPEIKNRTPSLSVKHFLIESNGREETREISGESSSFSEDLGDEFSGTGEENKSFEIKPKPTKSPLTSATILKQLKTTTTNLLKTNPKELNRIFVILMILIVVGEFLESPSFTLADAALLEHLGDERRYYGKQRLWGSLGFGIFSFIVGVLLEKSRHTVCAEQYTDYIICFCVFTLAMVLTLFTSTKFHFEYNSTPKSSASVLSALCNIHYGSCLMAACFMGFAHGMSHNFINWFIEDLGGSKTLMGVAVICRSIADLTTFFAAGFIINLVGQVKMMFVCLLCYGSIFISYSLIENSWSVLPIELLNGMTYAAAWSACTSYMAGASTADAVATIQGILQGVYWGLGSGSGAISGGLMIHHIGPVATFRFTAGGFFLGAIAFGLAQWRYNKESTERPPQTKYSYLPATPESKDTEALLSGYFTGSPKSVNMRRKKSYVTQY